MESLTYIKNVKISPKKLRFMLDEVKKHKPAEVLDYLFYSPQKSAQVYYKAIKSAVSNASNSLKVSPDVLEFKLLTIEEGRKLKRYRAGSRGMAKPILRRYSHIKIVLVEGEKSTKSPDQKNKRTQDQKNIKSSDQNTVTNQANQVIDLTGEEAMDQKNIKSKDQESIQSKGKKVAMPKAKKSQKPTTPKATSSRGKNEAKVNAKESKETKKK